MSSFAIDRIDHIVLTVEDIAIACEFYHRVLAMEIVTFGDNRRALRFGRQKLNLHEVGKEFAPKAENPTSGAIDLCLITVDSLDSVREHLQACGVEILMGPVQRTGATGAIESIYIRDPDRNLIEIARYLS